VTPARNTSVAYAFLAFCALGAAAVLFFFDPASHAFYPPCPLHALTGLDCPTCGGLRAAHLLLHGHLRAAFGTNPFLFFALPAAALLLLCPALARPRWVPWAALGILLAYFLWRNWA
jgi:hypothetical protein